MNNECSLFGFSSYVLLCSMAMLSLINYVQCSHTSQLFTCTNYCADILQPKNKILFVHLYQHAEARRYPEEDMGIWSVCHDI